MDVWPKQDLSDADLFIPSTVKMIRPYRITIPNGEIFPVLIPRGVLITPVTLPAPSLIEYTLDEPAAADALSSWEGTPNGYLVLTGRGRWWIKHNGAAPVTFLVRDQGGAGNAQALAESVITGPINLIQIAGTAQTALDLTGTYVAPTVFAGAVPFALTAGDSAMLAALATRKLLSVTNIGTSWAAIGAKASALTGLNDAAVFFILPPNSTYKFQKPSEPPPVAAIRVFTSGALSTIYMQQGS